MKFTAWNFGSAFALVGLLLGSPGGHAQDVGTAAAVAAAAAADAIGMPAGRSGTPRFAMAAAADDADTASVAPVDPSVAMDKALGAAGNFSISLGGWNASYGNGTSTLAVDRITNGNATRTTGTLKLRLVATTSPPALGQSFSAYRLSDYANLEPLKPSTYYYDIQRGAALTSPPDGTYYISVVLYEYSTTNCTAADGFCVVDLSVGAKQSTFGNPAPPPPPPTPADTGKITMVFSYAGAGPDEMLCVEQYPAAAAPVLRDAGLQVVQYPASTPCAALGFGYRLGPFSFQGQVIDPAMVVYARTADFASAACATGYVDCSGLNPGGGVEAIEYYNAGFAHYFVTAAPAEISALDGGKFAGWTRTGQTFKVFALGTAGASNVCRFFSTSFGIKSSHFYTPFAGECATVRGNPSWQLEGDVFALKLPSAAGACAGGTSPLYRLYNNGQGGAPNHRYTTSLTVRSSMLGSGWIPEGAGAIGVIGCVPN